MTWISRSLYHCPVPPAFIRSLRLLISVHSTPPASIRDLRLLKALRLLEVYGSLDSVGYLCSASLGWTVGLVLSPSCSLYIIRYCLAHIVNSTRSLGPLSSRYTTNSSEQALINCSLTIRSTKTSNCFQKVLTIWLGTSSIG